MKTRSLRWLCTLAFTLASSALCHADYQTRFNEAPYVRGETIVGVDGWVPTSSTKNGSSTYGIMVEAPWESEQTVLRLRRGPTANDLVRVKNQSFAPLDDKVTVVAGLAFDFNPSTTTDTVTRFGFTDTSIAGSPVTIGVSYSAGAGLFYQGSERVVILTKDQIMMNSLYEFTLTLDLTTKTFDIAVSGFKADASLFEFSASSIAMDAFHASSMVDGKPVINMLFVENTANSNFTSYLSHTGIRAIPEPDPAALMLGGGMIALIAILRRRCTKTTA